MPLEKSCDRWLRFLDVVLSAAALLLLSPVLIVTAVAVRLKMGSPVLFCQQRGGIAGTAFDVIKFRSMTNAKGADGKPLDDSVRLTQFGRLLRATSLDELPQLWCVLKGTLSLVGPRPLHLHYLPRYSKTQARRHEVRPGITGWAQVNGRNSLDWVSRFDLDVWYVDNRSVTLYFWILFRTVAQVIRRQGIDADGATTMTEFLGDASQT